MRTGRPRKPLILSSEERERLQSLAHPARSSESVPSKSKRTTLGRRAANRDEDTQS